jgi:hypothetical protein
MKRRFDTERPAILWHFENTQFSIPYCRDASNWWTGCSLSTDTRGQDITPNPQFVTCTKCLKKMKANGMKNPFSKEELELLKYLRDNNHIALPEDIEKADICYKLAASGHAAYQLGYRDEILFYETDIGNTAYNAVTMVYGEE